MIMSKKKVEEISLNGGKYQVVDAFIRHCDACGTEHQVILLKSFFRLDHGAARHDIPKLSYFCTRCGSLYVHSSIAEFNSDIIRAASGLNRR